MRDAPQLSDGGVDRISKILAYTQKNKKAMFYGVLATTNLLKCLWHPRERSEGHYLRTRLAPEAPRKPITKEDEPENPQIPSLKRRKSDKPKVGLGVENTFTSIMAVGGTTATAKPITAISVESSSSALGSNIRPILEDIRQLSGGSSKTEADAKNKVDADTKKVEVEVAQSEAASTHAENDQLEEAETKQAKIILEKEKLPNSKGKVQMSEALAETTPWTTMPKDPNNGSSMSDDLVKPSTID
ncbi:hypothetical protein FH972_017671 [Carpinus fangiana]|uniref:Uncharacterized protein n=1 Tax=Carpinus fangiana TaxID=176857 RepID=A0A5N6RJU7_9ROSI|nr:hypothetical protein FH972_017671 [Carpinus fangiana]